MIYKKTDLFVIVDEMWYHSNGELDFVYTDSDEVEKVANVLRATSSNPHLIKVMDINDFAEYNYSYGSEAASYER